MNLKEKQIVPPTKLIIASRRSRLAIWQAQLVKDHLTKLYPSCQTDILALITRGDQILDRILSKVGGKGLFVKELEQALLDGRADLAVHSLKDVPMELPVEFEMPAVMLREDASDVIVLPQEKKDIEVASPAAICFNASESVLMQLKPGAQVGTASQRRAVFITENFPHLKVKILRGNLDTRLSRLDNQEYDAIILAAAGLKRLGLGERIVEYLDPNWCIPAPGQGALGIEIARHRKTLNDLSKLLAPIHHKETALAIYAEREMSRLLGGSCELPIAAYATWQESVSNINNNFQSQPFISEKVTNLKHENILLNEKNIKAKQSLLNLSAWIALPASCKQSKRISVAATAKVSSIDDALKLGKFVADALFEQGAQKIIDEITSGK